MGLLEAQQYLLKSMREEKVTPDPNRVSQDPKVGVTVAVITLPPPSLLTCQSAGKQTDWPVELTVFLIFQEAGNLYIFSE